MILKSKKVKVKYKAELIMTISEIIEKFLVDLLSSNENSIEIQRNELANHFNCVPSQINYVIRTRFSAEQGYEVESKRGGGGYVKIRRVNVDCSNYLMHIVNCIRDSITQSDSFAYIKNFYDYNQIDEREAALMLSVVSDKSLMSVTQPERDSLRAQLLKNMLISLV